MTMVNGYEAPAAERVGEFLRLGRERGYWRNGYDFPRLCRQVFGGISLKGKRVLEIGSGSGVLSMWAGLCGASEVVALEPLEEGSGSFKRGRIYDDFASMTRALGLETTRILPKAVQHFRGEGTFDLVLSNASINHLDEPNCVTLKSSVQSREVYLDVLRGIAQDMNRGGKLIIMDVSSENMFNDLGLTNPFMKTIEWHKHHTPQLWGEICSQAGFSEPLITWPSGRYLRYLRIYSRPSWCSYLTDSLFRLEMTRS
ncbi:class I SAM-dependent methyltransferase [Geomonas subterranea]|uniref:Class I SAM-dependent methyltransferase n=1 Tax=Geomonas subterranea TaxID=2847989 RepID=A0ABX8LI04_9BACT|nr:methyltransferase domain-containing protein [Geomonas subterranea]QXE91671.1 class I SAM-dependent methyltransferase [Geomonas subterranea]QXM10235.1 class I SAM-dependent methyltransferase [Geomonas subterranea]